MKSIPLTKGKFALVDDEDFDLLTQKKWTYHSQGYAYHSLPRPKKEMLLMHRVILGAKKGQEVDHIDGNRLNNSKSNLRFCTSSQNKANQAIKINNTTGYKGVSFNKISQKYEAYINKDKQRFWLGSFENKIDAAKAYNKKADEFYGEYARKNSV